MMNYNKEPKIYLKIMGNAGNQFFQYAFARSIQEKLGGQLLIDYAWARTNPNAWPGCDRLLDDFNIVNYQYVTSEEPGRLQQFVLNRMATYMGINKIPANCVKTYPFYLFCARYLERFGIYYFGSCYYPFRYYKNKNIYIQGYFESAKYFKDIDNIICKELQAKHPLLERNTKLYDVITHNESVCISIKRRDIENNEMKDRYWYDINYFYHAIEYMKAKLDHPVFVVFSDNIEWCKDNFHIEGEVFYETSDNPVWEKLRLMSSCRHFIIHNSTFSWWAQHLSDNSSKLVVAPSLWLIRDDGQPIDIYEDNWIYMNNSGEVVER